MRILVTADLHYDHERSKPAVESLARAIGAQEGDALVLAGDTFAFELSLLEECLSLFAGFRGKKALVAGNHCIWVAEGGDSAVRYAEEISRVAARLGWHYLDRAPLVMGAVALVGNIGWYDYSFRDPSLTVPDRFYEARVAPGAALAQRKYHYLFSATDDLRPSHFRIASQWMDGTFVRWRSTDREFTKLAADKLAGDLAAVRDEVETIVAILHHVPFREMVRTKEGDASWNFANAFQGSPVFGDILRAEPKVKYLVCGHVHLPQEIRIGEIACYNVGSDIVRKRVVDLTIPAPAPTARPPS